MENTCLTNQDDCDKISENEESQVKLYKDKLIRQQKLERLIRKCFKLSKFYRHLESVFHKGDNK